VYAANSRQTLHWHSIKGTAKLNYTSDLIKQNEEKPAHCWFLTSQSKICYSFILITFSVFNFVKPQQILSMILSQVVQLSLLCPRSLKGPICVFLREEGFGHSKRD